MKEATLAQGNQLLNLILQHRVSTRKLQKVIESGLLTALLDADFSRLDKEEVLNALGYEGGKRRRYIATVGILDNREIFKVIKNNNHFEIQDDIVTFPGKRFSGKATTVEIELLKGSFSREFLAGLEERGFRLAFIDEYLSLFASYEIDTYDFLIGKLHRRIVTIITSETDQQLEVVFASDNNIYTKKMDENFEKENTDLEVWFSVVKL